MILEMTCGDQIGEGSPYMQTVCHSVSLQMLQDWHFLCNPVSRLEQSPMVEMVTSNMSKPGSAVYK